MSRKPQLDNNEGFVSRWSRRKSSARQAGSSDEISQETVQDQRPGNQPVDPALSHILDSDQAAEPNPVADAPGDSGMPANATGSTETATEPGEPPDLPDIDALTEQSDYSAFMAPNVSHEIRNLALRKLFRSQVFNIRDGLDDYDEDFTTFEKLGDIVTADMRHHAQRKKALAEQEPLAQEAATGANDDSVDDHHAERTDNPAAASQDTANDQQVGANDPLAADSVRNEPVTTRDPTDKPGMNAGTDSVSPAAEQPVLAGKLRRRHNPPDTVA